MSNPFVHLHVHSDYSLLDGACRVEDLAARAKAEGMPALACTDHGNMHAAVDFYKAALDQGVKPIIGCEFYVAPTSRNERNPRDPHAQGFHLVLLAEDIEGYRNLCRLNASAWLEGYYYKARIDKERLAQHSAGLIALSACLGGEVAARIREGNEREAKRALESYVDIFGRQHFFLELQDHGIPEQITVNRGLVAMGREFGLPLVATNDVHYLLKEHAAAHDVLLCIGTQAVVEEPKRMRFSGQEFYFKSAEEMAALFAEHPEALANTLAIAERCNLSLELGSSGTSHYPVYSVPDDTTRDTYLRTICVDGLATRYGIDAGSTELDADARAKIERMDYELDTIAKAGFTSYFLVVWDFIRFAKQQGIPVGPGRGSGAGSLVAYLTEITDIDPIHYGLLFERFLNPDRVSPPDFDIDLCERRRHEVIEYVRNKYGSENVAQIGTFGTLKAKQVVKDVARTLGRSFADGNLLTKLIPANPKITLNQALKESDEFRDLMESEEWVREIVRFSEVLEGLNRNMSIHAAGVIIGDQPLTNLVPLAKGAGDETITQYAAGPCEELGLLKMDFLGLRTLTIIQDTLDLVARHHGIRLKSADIPLEDPVTFALLNKGNTIAVFQLESGGMRDLCRRFGVSRLEDIIALIALYRPGPMQFLDDFIERKSGQTSIEYDLPEMKSILGETYGIMLYQEQVMQVVQAVGGFSLGQADIMRRAMGKKKQEAMDEQRDRFIAGALAKNVAREKAQSIWEKIEKFAGYGFNKSHSAAYAMLAYQTAYLKANYPTEFMAAVLSSELGNAEKLAFLLKECREMGLDVRPPDVNTSDLRFGVDGRSIPFGLAAIKGVGNAAAEAIIVARNAKPFRDLLDFCERVGSGVNRRVLESLCKAGAFDAFGLRRAQLFAILDEALSIAQRTAADRLAGQGSLFDMLGDAASVAIGLNPPDIPEWARRDLLGYEKELLGQYVSGHPLAEFATVVETYQIDPLIGVPNLADGQGTRVGGIIAGIDLKRSKRDNRPWAILRIEGIDGNIEAMVFADTYEKCADELVPERAVLVEGMLSNRGGTEEMKLLVERIIPLEIAAETLAREVHVHVHQGSADARKLEQFLDVCKANPGTTPIILCLVCATGEIAFVEPEKLKIRNSAAFRQGVKDIFGEECLVEKANRTRPTASGGKDGRAGRRGAWRQPQG